MVPPQKEDQNVCIGRVNAECSGTNLSETFITDRLTTEKKKQVKTWRTAAKNVKLAAGSRQKCGAAKTDLFARMLVVTKSRPEINPRETVKNMSFSLFQEQPLAQIVLCYTVHSKVAWRSCPLTTKKLVTKKFRQHT